MRLNNRAKEDLIKSIEMSIRKNDVNNEELFDIVHSRSMDIIYNLFVLDIIDVTTYTGWSNIVTALHNNMLTEHSVKEKKQL